MSNEPKDYRIFVVDDEPTIASTLEAIISTQGYIAHSFIEPNAALQAAQT